MATAWEEILWSELDQLPEEERVVVAGELIVYITRVLLPGLGDYRREVVLAILARPGWDATRLAETIGSRRTTVTRLAEEGRKRRRVKTADEAIPDP